MEEKSLRIGKKVKWRCHTPNLLKEIAEINVKGLETMYHPINIFREMLCELTKRCSEINDNKLNAIMCRLTLYEIADPESKGYNPKLLHKILRKAEK